MADDEPKHPATDGAAIAEQLNATTSEDAGGNVSGTAAKSADSGTAFEPADPDDSASGPSHSGRH